MSITKNLKQDISAKTDEFTEKNNELEQAIVEKENSTINYDLAKSLHEENEKKGVIINKVSKLIDLATVSNDLKTVKSQVTKMLKLAENNLTQIYKAVDNTDNLSKHISSINDKGDLSPDIATDSVQANKLISTAYIDAQTAYQNSISALKAVVKLEYQLKTVQENLNQVSFPNKNIKMIEVHFANVIKDSKGLLDKCKGTKEEKDENFENLTIDLETIQKELKVLKEEEAVIVAINA